MRVLGVTGTFRVLLLFFTDANAKNSVFNYNYATDLNERKESYTPWIHLF